MTTLEMKAFADILQRIADAQELANGWKVWEDMTPHERNNPQAQALRNDLKRLSLIQLKGLSDRTDLRLSMQ